MTSDLITLADRPLAGGPPWLADLRQRGREAARTTGLPTTKLEAWRFTSVAALGRTRFEAVDDLPRVSGIDGRSVIRFSEAWNDPELRRLLEATTALEHFGALNTSRLADGLMIRISRAQALDADSTPIEIAHVARTTASPTVAHPRLLIVVEREARAHLVESYDVEGSGVHLTNAVTEVVLEAGAELDHTRVLYGTKDASHVGKLSVHQDRDSRYRSKVATIGGAISRLDLTVALSEPGAECELDGVYMAETGEHVDHHLVVDHFAPHCTSRERYRGIVGGKGQAVWDGTAIVHRDAQQSNAHQENRNLMLSDDAVIHTKPHLRIDADDVKCSHGATIGTLDKDQLFYMRARGIAEPVARAILTYAFVEATVDQIPVEATRRRLSDAILGRLPGSAVVREVLCQE